MTQSKQCTCASFFTVRGVHKKDCPLFTEPHCNCSHFQTQIINHGAGSYTTRFTWQCPIHGTLHKDFEAPEGFAPSKHERGQAIKHHLNRLSNNTYTCEHGVVQKIGTHSHAPVMDMTEKKCEHGNESWDCSKCIRKALTRPTTDTAERNCRTSAIAEVKEMIGGMKVGGTTDYWVGHDKALSDLLTKLTDNK